MDIMGSILREGGGAEAVNAPLMHLITFSDSTAAVLLLAQFEGLPSKTVEGLQHDNKFPVDPIPFG